MLRLRSPEGAFSLPFGASPDSRNRYNGDRGIVFPAREALDRFPGSHRFRRPRTGATPNSSHAKGAPMQRRTDARDDHTLRRPNRRDFLRTSALAAAAAAGSTALRPVRASSGRDLPGLARLGRSNTMPGRIVVYHDPAMEGQLSTINLPEVERVVHHGVRLLTGHHDTGEAFASLFPGLHSGSTIAIKINLIGPCDSRWETVRGILTGLAQMLGGTYDISQVTIYDQHNLYQHGFRCDPDHLEIDGVCPNLQSTANCGSYYVYGGHRLSGFVTACDYLINVPVIKSHNNGNNQITHALKNHYGSCCPQSLCGNIPGMLSVNADPYIKEKTSLVLMDGLRGTYNGGPTLPAQSWLTYPEQTPNTLFFSTDPVTNDYWGRDTINAERLAHGWSEKPAPWVEEASQEPYVLGVSDPDAMDVRYYDPTAVGEEGRAASATFLAPNVPNPFTHQTMLRLRMARPGSARLTITDANGRVVRSLGERTYRRGYAEIPWDGRDDAGRRVPAGAYFARLRSGDTRQTRTLLRVQ
ncbi:MAG: DUF362 domain-containing protein [Candidatus Eisenbacteria bacterium]|nr:DUF362 domain-containing protein [Candidatus Eisenbacteria bacterium]